MNVFTILLTFVLTMFQTNPDLPNKQLASAFQNMKAEKVVALSKDKVLIGIDGEESVYSLPQAQQVLQRFFDAHKNGEFTYSFEGDQTKETTFTVAEYVYKERPYRVTTQYRKSGNTYKIESLSIE